VAALAVAAFLWAAVTGVRTLAVLAVAIAVASLFRREQTPLSTPLQGLLLLASGLSALALISVMPPDGALADRALRREWAVAGGGALLLAAMRIHLLRPEGGAVVTVGLGLLVFLACGSVLSGRVYPALLLVYTPLFFAALRANELERPSWRVLGWRHRVSLALIAVSTTAGTVGLVLTLPRLYESADTWALSLLEGNMQSGFHDGPMALGSLEGMLQSNQIVLRVEGPVGEPLRGNVYNRYARQHWLAPHERDEATRVLADSVPEAGSEVTTIRHVGDEADRFFLPLDVSTLELEPVRVHVDHFGVVRPPSQERPKRVRLLAGLHRRIPPLPPGPDDLALPEELEVPLVAIAAGWTGGAATTPATRIDAIRTRLERDYTYSLEFDRGTGSAGATPPADPVLHFLQQDPQGHCEYFASALALLARASGVPSRVVTGYRVVERNTIGNYHIVRERHAHAWVEVHLPERGWVTVDPSPLQSFENDAPSTTSLVPGLMDWGALAFQRHGATPLLVLLLMFFAGIQLRRLWVGRRRTLHSPQREPSRPPVYMEELLEQLAALGWARADGETLESYARRLASSALVVETVPPPDGEVHRRAAEPLLLRYAALRYGGRGNADALHADVHAWLREAVG
jgi:transglutaminase-like putative cysteine protease